MRSYWIEKNHEHNKESTEKSGIQPFLGLDKDESETSLIHGLGTTLVSTVVGLDPVARRGEGPS